MPAPYVRDLIWRFWWCIALCALGVGLGAGAADAVLYPVYQSTALVEVALRTTTNPLVADRVAHNEVTLATAPSILNYAAVRNPPLTAAHLRSKVSATVVNGSEFVSITAQDTNPRRAASIANAIASALVANRAADVKAANAAAQQPLQQTMSSTQQEITQVNQQLTGLGTPPSDPTQAANLQEQLSVLQTQLAQAQTSLTQMTTAQANSSIELAVAQAAAPAVAPGASRIVESAIAGMAAGFLLGLLLVLALDWLNWRVRSSAEVHALLGADVLAEINGDALTEADDRGADATSSELRETWESLERALQFQELDHPARMIVALSPDRARAAAALAAGLALRLAASGRRTLLVDGNLAIGRQSGQFGIPNRPGLSDAALDARTAAAADITPIAYARPPTNAHAPTLLVLPSGAPPPNADRVLASRSMDRVLSALPRSGAEIVILNAPPLLGPLGLSRGAKACLRHADGALLLVDMRYTRKDQLLRVQSLLAAAETTVLGCVVVTAPEQAPAQADGVAHARSSAFPPAGRSAGGPISVPPLTLD